MPTLFIVFPTGWKHSPFGPAGLIAQRGTRRIIISDAPATDPDTGQSHEWRHASISRTDKMPTYADLQLLHQIAWGEGQGHAYQCFVPPTEHINIHDLCLHLWGRSDGTRALPAFAQGGTI
jgi:hypothetical protein